MDWTAWVGFMVEARDFSLLQNVQTCPGAHTASYPVGTGGSFPGAREADHSFTSCAEVKNSGATQPIPHTFSWHSA
jgi:hypothetical protein